MAFERSQVALDARVEKLMAGKPEFAEAKAC